MMSGKKKESMIRLAALLANLLWTVGTGLASTMPDPKIERVPLDQGAALHLTYCMTQTRDGFLWFGTMYGLVRYDGYSYLTFRYDPADSASLSNDDIVTLFEDSRGDLWVGTYGGGVNRFARSTSTFQRFRTSHDGDGSGISDVVWSIREDRDSNIWLATESSGLVMLDRKSGEMTRYTHSTENPSTISDNRVTAIDIDQAGRVWAATSGGLNSVDPSNGVVVRYDLGGIDGRPVIPQTLLLDGVEQLWVGTAGFGILMLDPKTAQVRTVPGRQADVDTYGSLRVNVLVADNEGMICAGTSKGVLVLDREGTVVRSYHHDPENPASLHTDAVFSLCVDQGGILWASSYPGGVSRILASGSRFTNYLTGSPENIPNQILALAGIDESRILVASSSGLFEVDLEQTRASRVSLPEKSGVGPRMIRSLFRDSQGRIWLGTVAGLFQLDAEFRIVASYRHDRSDPSSISSNQVLTVIEDRKGNIWAGTAQGLNRLVPGTDRFDRYMTRDGGLRNDFVLSLFEDSDENIWIGTYGGTAVLGKDRETFHCYLQSGENPEGISNNYALAFCETSDGSVWIGTGGGLNKFNRGSGTFSHFLTRHGLPNGVITGILDTGDGILWLSTHYGLSRFDTRTGGFSNYDERDGLPGTMFLTGASLRTSGGDVLFGGLDGLTAFRPSEIPVRQFAPPVVLTRFDLLRNPDSLMKSVSNGDVVSLSHSQNYFSLEFASLDFLRPSKNLYSYKLDGIDDEWISSGGRRTATYTDLPPGEYLFRVRATNGDGVWSAREATLGIIISPPFWQTWWFRVLVVAAMAASIGMAYRTRLRRRIQRVQELERVRQEAAEAIRKKAARDFHDELGHRLTKIGLFAELVRRKVGPSSLETAAHIDKIIQSSQALTNDTRDFLWSLDPGKDSLYDLVSYLNGFGEELFERTGITFHPAELNVDMKGVKLTMDFRRHLSPLLAHSK